MAASRPIVYLPHIPTVTPPTPLSQLVDVDRLKSMIQWLKEQNSLGTHIGIRTVISFVQGIAKEGRIADVQLPGRGFVESAHASREVFQAQSVPDNPKECLVFIGWTPPSAGKASFLSPDDASFSGQFLTPLAKAVSEATGISVRALDLEPAAPSAGVIKSAWAEDDDEPDGWSLQSDAEEKNICREFVEMLLAHLDPAQNQIVGIVLLGDVASAAWGITQLGVTELRFPHQPQAVLSSILHPRSYRAVKDDGRLAAHAVKIVGETLIRAGVLESCTTLWDSFRSFYDCPLRSSADMIEVLGESLDDEDFDAGECLRGQPIRAFIVHNCGAHIALHRQVQLTKRALEVPRLLFDVPKKCPSCNNSCSRDSCSCAEGDSADQFAWPEFRLAQQALGSTFKRQRTFKP